MSYQLFAGKFAEKNSIIYKNEAKNTSDELTYRIPSLLSVKRKDGQERIISLFDFSQSGGDFGRIQVKERHSDDGGNSFSEMRTILSLPVQKAPQQSKDYYSAFAIDPILVQCKNGDILIIVDVYPESKGLMMPAMLNKGSGYINVNGKNYLALYKQKTKLDSMFSWLRKPYTVREEGIIYNPNGEATNYYINTTPSSNLAFEDVGDLYFRNKNGLEDTYCGNIFLSKNKTVFSEKNPTEVKKRTVGPNKKGSLYSLYECVETDPAPLSVLVKSYLWVLRSKDGGDTWETPVDITGSLMKEDEIFLGTGPGTATCLDNGRILVPLYNTKNTCVAYSDDNGYSWKRSENSLNIDETQLVECLDNTILCFGRQKGLGKIPVSISNDHGVTWKKMNDTDLCSIKCQKSFIKVPLTHYTENMDINKTYVLVSTPTGKYGNSSKRYGGAISIGEVENDHTVKWLHSMKITYDNVKGNEYNFFAYSSMTPLEDGNFAIFYEALPSGLGVFEKFTLNQLFESNDLFRI